MKRFLKIGLPLLVLTGLIVGLALPVAAADRQPPAPVPAKRLAPPNVVGGEVTAIAADKRSFTIRPVAGEAVTIKVDGNTKYYKLAPPAPPQDPVAFKERALERVEAMKEKAVARLDALKERIKSMPNDRGLGNKGQQTPPGTPRPAPVPPAPPIDSDEAFLKALPKAAQQATFDDIAIGDHVVVRTMPNENLAKYVVIHKRPPVAHIQGTITALTSTELTITPGNGQPLTLGWDKETRFAIKGATAVQTGQNASVMYNTETKKALAVNIRTS